LKNQKIFLTAFEEFEDMQNLKMLWLPGLCPRPPGGAYSAPPDLLAEISNILFEINTEILRKKQF